MGTHGEAARPKRRKVTETAWYRRRLRDFRSPVRVVSVEERTTKDELEVCRRVQRYREQGEQTGRIDFDAVLLEAFLAGGFDPVPEHKPAIVLLPVRDLRWAKRRRYCG